MRLADVKDCQRPYVNRPERIGKRYATARDPIREWHASGQGVDTRRLRQMTLAASLGVKPGTASLFPANVVAGLAMPTELGRQLALV